MNSEWDWTFPRRWSRVEAPVEVRVGDGWRGARDQVPRGLWPRLNGRGGVSPPTPQKGIGFELLENEAVGGTLPPLNYKGLFGQGGNIMQSLLDPRPKGQQCPTDPKAK